MVVHATFTLAPGLAEESTNPEVMQGSYPRGICMKLGPMSSKLTPEYEVDLEILGYREVWGISGCYVGTRRSILKTNIK
jgi:hypothetical protein